LARRSRCQHGDCLDNTLFHIGVGGVYRIDGPKCGQRGHPIAYIGGGKSALIDRGQCSGCGSWPIACTGGGGHLGAGGFGGTCGFDGDRGGGNGGIGGACGHGHGGGVGIDGALFALAVKDQPTGRGKDEGGNHQDGEAHAQTAFGCRRRE
jgi:hypothetical protein